MIDGGQLGLNRFSRATGPWGMTGLGQRLERRAENAAFNGINGDPDFDPNANRQNLFVARMLIRYGYSAEEEAAEKAKLNKAAADSSRRLISPA